LILSVREKTAETETKRETDKERENMIVLESEGNMGRQERKRE
jgi:hypothetical protein